MSRDNIHATGLVLDGHGLILRGPSGSGKSLLALLLLEAWDGRGKTAKLVSDDRVEIAAEAGALTLHAPATIEGLIELRGRGIAVARCPVPRAGKIGTLHQLLLVGEALRALPAAGRTRKKTA